MSQLGNLLEQRSAAAYRIRVLADRANDEGREFTADEKRQWEAANADFDASTARAVMLEQGRVAFADDDDGAVAQDRRDRSQTPGREDTHDARGRPFFDAYGRRNANQSDEREVRSVDLGLQAWMRADKGLDLTPQHRSALRRIGGNADSKWLDIRLPIGPLKRSLGEGTTAAGGALVPQGFMASLEQALKDFSAVRSAAATFRTETGNPMPWPNVNDTANAGTLLAEAATVAEVDMPFATVVFNAYKFTSGLVTVSAELLQDSAINLGEVIGQMLGERIGRGQGSYLTTGTGTNQPQGIVTGATLGVTTASSTAIAPDEVFAVLHSVDPAYRRSKSFGWMMHDQILLAIRKLKDSQNRYLWEPSLQAGQPDTLLGAPVYGNQFMASTLATGNKVILVGDFSKMKVRDAGPIRLRRLEERYADQDLVGFIAFRRSDSHLIDAGTAPIKYMKML